MTDRELLELAAKAAGMNYVHDLCGRYSDPEFNEVVEWNPLTDDGDALRLAVKLEMCVDFIDRRVIAGAASPEVVIDFEDNDYRRAIVRAAAEIERQA